MATRYNTSDSDSDMFGEPVTTANIVSDSPSTDEGDIIGGPVAAAAAAALNANLFYGGRLRDRTPKKSEGQDDDLFSDSSPTTVDDSDTDKHYVPPVPSPMKTRSYARSRGRGSRSRGGIKPTAEVGSESSPLKRPRGRVSTRSRARSHGSRSRGSKRHTAEQ